MVWYNMKKITLDFEKFIIAVEFDHNEDIEKLVLFELKRISSLQDRDITVISDVRIWDEIREITVRKRDEDA